MKEQIVNIIVEKLGVRKSEISDFTKFREDLGCDSLDILEIIMATEKELNIIIPDDDLDEIITVMDLVNYCQSK